MLRLFQLMTGLITLVFEVIAVVYFNDWFRQTDWLMGHVYGPASSLITAMWMAGAALIGTTIWIVIALVRWNRSDHPPKRRRWLIIQSLIVVLFLAPAGIIFAVSVAELPRARRQLEMQRKVEDHDVKPL